MTQTILDDPAYRISIERIEQAVRDHHRLLEDWGNEHDVNDDGTTDNTVVVGWVLAIGQVGFSDGREFHGALVEHPATLNSFMALGLADYAVRFLREQTNDYSTMTD